MPTLRTPSLRRHKGVNQGVVVLNGHSVYLGPWPSSARKAPVHVRQAYDRAISEWLANGRQAPARHADAPLTVAELVARFFPHVEQHYRRPDGTATSEVDEFRYTLRPLVHLYSDLPADQLSPLKLKATRRLMIEGYHHPKYGPQEALCRILVNKRVGRIVRMMKWAVGEELIPAETYHGLKAVTGLQRGRTEARETEPIRPVVDADVDAVLPYVSAEVAAMIRLQRLTGMRPGEACAFSAIGLDMSGDVWLYRPEQHKMAYRGKPRVIAIGPKGQQVIKQFLQVNPAAYLFSPKRARERRFADMRANRKTPVQPSQLCRQKRKPKKLPRDRYSTSTYCQAISDACDKAFPAPAPLARLEGESNDQWQARLTTEQKAELIVWQKSHRWHPNQLRHSHATEVRRQFGLEAAQVALGHDSANITELYAERNAALAAKVAKEVG